MRRSRLLLWVFLAALVLTLGAAWRANAEWRIDPARFHISAHGELSCLECHAAKAKDAAHPDPKAVGKNLKDIFKPAHCTACHGVEAGLKAGLHGTLKVDDPKRFENCIRCHNPHYQARISGADRAKFNQAEPRSAQCGACHEFKKELPKPGKDATNCVVCHLAGGVATPKPAQKTAMCASCHDSQKPAAPAKGVELAAMTKGPHKGLSCFDCHPESARFPHNRQDKVDCAQCHVRHDEKTAGGDAHFGVSCQSCHLEGVAAQRVSKGGPVIAASLTAPGKITQVHTLVKTGDEANCARCHAGGNKVGAAAMALPAKSLMCMPCHTATFSVGDTASIAGLGIFLIGLIGAFSFWFTGSLAVGEGSKAGAFFGQVFRAVFSMKIGRMIKALLLDGMLQRRLWKICPWRGLIHNLIFFPFLVRFAWGIIALLGSLLSPESDWAWAMVNKNHPATAFIFDLSGVMVLLGVAAAVSRRFLVKPRTPRPAGLPKPDFLAMGLLLGIVLVGFIAEGMRIAMTGAPAGAGYAFLGYALSFLFNPATVGGAYGYIWYAHAILTAGFAAYLPFSRMFHIILAPLVIAAGAAQEHEDH